MSNRKQCNGTDDKQYILLMEQYKMMRRINSKRDEANQLLQEAFRLSREGDVSRNAHSAGADI